MKFEKLTTPSEIVDYLKKILSRTGGKKSNNIFLYHYTTVDALCGILESNTFHLGSSKKMNDLYEKFLLERQDLCNRLYYLCCSTTGDNISLWNMYGKEKGIMIAIPYTYAKTILENTKELSTKNSHMFQDVYWTAVSYCSKEESKSGTRAIRSGSVDNYNIENPPQKEIFAGFMKSKGWSNENEVRFSVVLSEDSEKSYVEIPLPKGFLSECKFFLSPFIRQKDIFNTINKVRHISDAIKIENSMYMGEILQPEESN